METLEYITGKAMMQCEQGSVPGLFTPTYNTTIKINTCLVSTKADKIPIANIPSFVVCKKTKKPCVPVPTEWQDTYPVKVKGQPTLIGQSCNNCAIGGKINFLTSGQVPLTPDEEAELNSVRDDAQKAYEEEQEEANKPWWKKAGEFVVDCVPVVGPVISLVKNVSKGNWGMALLDVGFLALDVVSLAAAPFTGGASVAGATAVKMGARQAIKAGAKQVAKKLSREALEAGAKQTAEMLGKLTVRSLSRGRLCVFACFTAGTPVATKEGLINIEDIQAGNEVWSYDELTGEVGLKPVTHTFERAAGLLVKIEIDGEVITTTPEHPFYANGEWKEAGLLQTDDSVLLFSGRLAKVNHVKYKGVSAPVEDGNLIFEAQEAVEEEPTKVYNFEVEGWHTYFVGSVQLLVHNSEICLKKAAKEISEGVKNAVHKVSRSQYPNHTRMLENAAKEGHSTKNLTRGKGTKAAKKNRYESQKEIRKKQGGPKDGHDYDEFPYASTKQGGKGAHVEEVPSLENQAAGRDLGEFYRKNNIKPGDGFDIEIIK